MYETLPGVGNGSVEVFDPEKIESETEEEESFFRKCAVNKVAEKAGKSSTSDVNVRNIVTMRTRSQSTKE